MKKLRTITRAIAMLLFTAAWLAASTASLLHDVLHHGVLYHSGAHGSASHYHGQKSWGAAITVAQVDAADTHPAYSSLSVCFFCLNGPLTLALAAVAMLVSLPQFFRFRARHSVATVADQRFLLPSFRAPPRFGVSPLLPHFVHR